MKYFLYLFFTVLFIPAEAQKMRSVDDVANALKNEVFFVKYKDFKNDFEKMTIEKAKQLSDYQDYEKLKISYKEVEFKYNGFLIEVKNDLSRWENVQKMIQNPSDYALKYQQQFVEVEQTYKSKYLPVYQSIGEGKSVSLIPVLIEAGIELFTSIIGLIKGRKEERQSSMNLILGTINTYFYSQIKMKEWGELGIFVPSYKKTYSNNTKDELQGAAVNERLMSPEMSVPAPNLDEIKGWVEFNILDANKKTVPMSFQQTNSKDIVVEDLVPTEGNSSAPALGGLGVMYLNSITKVSNGTQFNIRVSNKSGLYIITLTSDNKVDFLYPFKNERLGNCNPDRASGKDITILEATPLVGQANDGVITLPLPNCDNTPPALRYFTVQGNQIKPEIFCILFSRSELNVREIKKYLEAESGALPNRISKIFGNYLIDHRSDAQINVEDNRIYFDASSAKKNVLPVIFYLNRK